MSRIARAPLLALVALALVTLALIAGACTTGSIAPSSPPDAGRTGDHRLYVTSNDWHTRIVVATADLGRELIPERADLAPADWLAIGWGDRQYYPMPDPPRSLALRAALLPSPAVVHLIPRRAPPRPTAGFEVLEIAVTGPDLERMLVAIDGEIERSGAPRAPIAAPGLYPESLFYPAKGSFHLFNTCNSWVARQLQEAGLPIRAAAVVTADDLMRQLRPLARASLPGG